MKCGLRTTTKFTAYFCLAIMKLEHSEYLNFDDILLLYVRGSFPGLLHYSSVKDISI